ncbi:hypothetical protein QV13_00945 [Mesorhizobium hungaricum]|uniref:Uncharacterized protein n=1 Tax=Mesorhizobium hungaricum TaxID=1566387 RepID=A0A1C2EDP2_9HYPH|nr:hypothetical protein QV13_00945 [Mesorhizobium hungaricum]
MRTDFSVAKTSFPLPAQSVLALVVVASEFAGHPGERAEDGGTVITGNVHDVGFDDKTAQFN